MDAWLPGMAISPAPSITMFIDELIDPYVASRNKNRPIGKELKPDTRRHFCESASAFSSWLKRRARLEDFRAETVNQFLIDLLGAYKSPYTAKNRRTALAILWRYAHRCGLCEPLKDVRFVHCPVQQIEGYDVDEMRRLLEYFDGLNGVVRRTRIPRSIYWPAAVRVIWDFGLRAGDIVSATMKDHDPRGLLWLIENKTGKRKWRPMRGNTRLAVEICIAADRSRDFIWPGYCKKSFYRAFARLAHRAGLPGTSRWMRRGSSSIVEFENPGMGWRFLNHSVPSLFENHYRVERICNPSPVAPTEL